MFPSSIPTWTPPDPNQTLDQNNHTARHASYEENITELATKVGVDSSVDVDSHEYKISALESGKVAYAETSTAGMGFVLDEDSMSSNSATKLATQQSIKAYVDSAISTAISAAKQALYPVGSYYINETDSTNPGTLLGFGTWVAVEDKTIIGKGSGTFATAGDTGGSETHSHSHISPVGYVGQPSHMFSNSTYSSLLAANGNSKSIDTSSQTRYASGSSATGSTEVWTIHSTEEIGLPPYIVAYIWKRVS
jgi:hypothetical protein